MKRLLFVAAATLSFAAFADVQADWNKHCKSCHGATGKADTKVGKKEKIDDMTNPEWKAKWTAEKMKPVIEDGIADTKMKAFKDKLKSEEIDALIKHIQSFK